MTDTAPATGFITRPVSLALDALRGLTAVVVLLGHAVQQGLYTGPWPFSPDLQHNAVVVFFVLSGLVIANSVFRRRTTLADYAATRLARVGPMALLAVVLGLAAWSVGQWGPVEPLAQDARYLTPGLASVVMPLLFMSESLAGQGPLWNTPFWSLVYEVWFYALFGAAIYLRGWRRVAWLAALALLAGRNVLLLLPVWLIGVALARPWLARPVAPNTAFALVIGGLLLSAAADYLNLLFMVILMELLTATGDELANARFALADLLFGLGLAMLFVGLRPVAERHGPLLERLQGPIRWLAECSFTLYLIHWPLLSVLHAYGLSVGSNPLLFAVAAAAIVALAGQVAKVTEHRRPQVRRWLVQRWPFSPQRVAMRDRALALAPLPVVAAFAGSAWLVAPTPYEPLASPRTMGIVAQAPFADQIVLGDSRTFELNRRTDVLYAAYPGATIGQMQRLATTLCRVSSAPVVIALGANDAQEDMRRPAVSLAALQAMVQDCGPQRVWVAEVWPGEPAKLPTGPDFDPATIAAINQGIRAMTAAGTGRLVPLPGHAVTTRDGIHFDEPTAARFEAMLATATSRS